MAGFFKRIWKRFKTPSARYGAGVLLAGGLVAGIALTVAFGAAYDYTNSTKFCLSCHSLQWAADEWRESSHYNEATGFRAECQDCHVPDDFFWGMREKILSYRDVVGQIRGTIDTEEKFEERRPLLAERVWSKLEATDSRECRSCHMEEIWDLEEQSGRARREHQDARETGETCIECHRGVAHKYPKEEEEVDYGF